MKLIAGLMLCGLAAAAGSPAAAAPSFNCKYARLSAEKALCSNRTLQRYDRQMARLYGFALSNPYGYSIKKLKTGQKQWLTKRNSCGWDAACLAEAYLLRNEWLENFGD